MVISTHIKESLGLKQWGYSDLHVDPEEARIMSNWGITRIPEFFGYRGNTT